MPVAQGYAGRIHSVNGLTGAVVLNAAAIGVSAGAFSGNLSPADDTVQKALATVDAMPSGGGGGIADHYAEDAANHAGLNYAYKAGRVRDDNGVSATVAGTVLLVDDDINYVEVDPADGVVSANIVGFTAGCIPLAIVETDTGEVVTPADDQRGWAANGPGGAGATALADLTDVSIPSPNDGEALTYNAGCGTWQAVAGIADHYAEDPANHSGLDYAYRAGRVRLNNAISVTGAGTVTLANNTTNYVEVNPVNGVVSDNASGFTADRIPLAIVVTSGGAITTPATDKRGWAANDGEGVGVLTATGNYLFGITDNDGCYNVALGGVGNAFSADCVENQYGVLIGGCNNILGCGAGDAATLSGSTIIGGRDNAVVLAAYGSDGFNTIIGACAGVISSSSNSTILGAYSSTISGSNASSILGGACQTVYASYSVIVGGDSNAIGCSGCLPSLSFIGGGQGNFVGACYGVIGGGVNHLIEDGATYAFIGGGYSNDVCGSSYAFIGGGDSNAILCSPYSLIVGGQCNTIACAGCWSVIGGGYCNQIYGTYGVIGGGCDNFVDCGAANGFIGGGDSNQIDGSHGVIGGGVRNFVGATFGVIGGGGFNSNYGFGATIGGGDSNQIDGASGVIGGGYSNDACATFGVIGGGGHNANYGFGATIGGGECNQIDGAYGVIGGGCGNFVDCGACYGVIGGGQYNANYGFGATIGGGYCNTIMCADGATIIGGYCGTVDSQALYSVIVGGFLGRAHIAGQRVESSDSFSSPGDGQGFSLPLSAYVYDDDTPQALYSFRFNSQYPWMLQDSAWAFTGIVAAMRDPTEADSATGWTIEGVVKNCGGCITVGGLNISFMSSDCNSVCLTVCAGTCGPDFMVTGVCGENWRFQGFLSFAQVGWF